ncbi:MAG: efflux RND transporter periplasmic adaptor subunit [Nitrosomonadales bacterium]
MIYASNLIKHRATLLGAVAFIALSGTGVAMYGAARANEHPAAVAAPAVPVSVQTINPQNVRVWSTFSGRMQAVDYAEVRPEVSGRITDVRIKDGQNVKAGDILFVIDPRPYEAAAAKAEANLASATTNAGFAQIEFDRAANLVKTQAIPQDVYDQRANGNRMAQAAVLAADAELKQARIDLDHAYVKAPIAGRVSRAEITLGNHVQSGAGAPVLTSIVSNDGIYADFEVDEQTYMKSIHDHADTQDKERRIPVELTIQGDTHSYKGTVYSFDNRIDASSGTIRARAKFANEDGSLVPGMFVSVKLADSSNSTALLVPERAIGNDQSKKFVYVVGNDNKVAYHEVTLGDQVDGQRIVISGLQAGERVIVEGLQHVRPDVTVQTNEVALKADPAHKLAAN